MRKYIHRWNAANAYYQQLEPTENEWRAAAILDAASNHDRCTTVPGVGMRTVDMDGNNEELVMYYLL